MDIESVAVYSDADRNSTHLTVCDKANPVSKLTQVIYCWCLRKINRNMDVGWREPRRVSGANPNMTMFNINALICWGSFFTLRGPHQPTVMK